MHPNDGRVVSNFIVKALKGENLIINGDGSQTRSFCYVDELIAGIIHFMDETEDFTGPMNIGNPEEISILELATKVLELTHSKSKVEFKPLPENDPMKRRPDMSLAKKMINWAPTVPLVEGLKKTIAYFKTSLTIGKNSTKTG
jgi:UDP-glucuronate decarboxylase